MAGKSTPLPLKNEEHTCVEDLVEEASDEGGSDVKLREQQRQAGVACLPQPQTLLVLLVDSVAAQHALEQLWKERKPSHDHDLYRISMIPPLKALESSARPQ